MQKSKLAIVTNPNALKLFMNDPVFHVKNKSKDKTITVPNILILVNYTSSANTIPESDKSFLIRIFNSINIQVEDSDIVNLAKNSISTEDLTKNTKAKKIIMFGLEESIINFLGIAETEEYKCFDINQNTLLRIPSLNEIKQDKTKKNLLWKALKKIFEI